MTTTVIGNYQYHNDEKDVLGKGAFGTVYKGQHTTDTAQIVAVKRIGTDTPAFNKTDKNSLDREIEILGTLSTEPHLHIVRQLHFQKTTEGLYIVMEFCNGGSLQKYLDDRGGKLDEKTIKLFFKQIFDGMIVLHKKNIIHRDLKPENIMLCLNSAQANPTPDDFTLKIVDFGIGRFLRDGEMAVSLCGTFEYMAPEIRLYGVRYDYKVDLWSIGIIIHQCITGGVDQQVRPQDIKPPSNCSEDLKDLLRRLLCIDPKRRIDYDAVLRHTFLGNPIQVAVNGSMYRTINVVINENDLVDSLIEKIAEDMNLTGSDSEVYLIHPSDTKMTLESGSGQSLSDAGIKNHSSITFCVRQSGGIKVVETL